MIENQDNSIPIDSPKSEFDHFLTDRQNKRIFFSGKFGIGKTFFLERFFEAHKEEYDAYHLFPVRYQISSNENIMELVKYDILIELLRKYPDAFKNKEAKGAKGLFRLFAAFCKDRGSINGSLKSTVEAGEGLLAFSPDPLFQALGKLGRPLVELLAIDKEFQEFKKDYLSGEKGAVEKFLKEIITEINLVATDYVSELLLQRIEELKGDRKSVLILDDFDRIDPEHIFRILNVLSAHMEGDEGNKFGFDYIIIVGDIRNVKSIFHHKYGLGAEFWGYFDKFFTVKPYEFNNAKAISERIPYLLQQIKHEEPNLKGALGNNGLVKHFLQEVLGRAFLVGNLNLRQLYKPINHSFPEMKKGSYEEDKFFKDTHNQCIDIGVKLLIAMYGERDHCLTILRRIRDNSPYVGTESPWFYESYTSSMLKRLVSLKHGETMQWHDKYSLIAETNPNRSNSIDIRLQSGKPSARFFYDTLVEYVTHSKYEKRDEEYYS